MNTHNWKQIFGRIINGQMILSGSGYILKKCWRELPKHYPTCSLDAFIIMPHHIHGIITIKYSHDILRADPANYTAPVRAGFKPAPTLSEIIRAFKTFAARKINQLLHASGSPLWQRGFNDHIIRDYESLENIREYIRTNPERWNHRN